MIDNISVYQTRLNMGRSLAKKIKTEWSDLDIDVVIPIPDTSRPSAHEVALMLNAEFREGFIKNRYIGRTFIMPGQELRKKSVRQKLNPIKIEFQNKNVLLIDDSIVRGTTSKEIIHKHGILSWNVLPSGIDVPFKDARCELDELARIEIDAVWSPSISKDNVIVVSLISVHPERPSEVGVQSDDWQCT